MSENFCTNLIELTGCSSKRGRNQGTASNNHKEEQGSITALDQWIWRWVHYCKRELGCDNGTITNASADLSPKPQLTYK